MTVLPPETERPLVSVCCMTYNQETTIAQTLEGILSQQTDFAFELIVHDDASDDRTADIVREYADRYPDIIRPIYQTENQYHRYNLLRQFILPAARGRLIAFCEGDDYWTDPDKLSLQAHYMLAHPACTLCFHAVQQLSPDGDMMLCRPRKTSGEVPASLIVKRGGLFCPTASAMYRRDVADCWPAFRMAADVYDYPMQVLAAAMGGIYYMDRVMAVYRFASAGSWTGSRLASADPAHVANEAAWLEMFNQYTGGKFENAVNCHMAHMWLHEYQKAFDREIKKSAGPYIRRLPVKERVFFSALFAFFSVGGRFANKLFHAVKKLMLK